jgi:hypothetical protein
MGVMELNRKGQSSRKDRKVNAYFFAPFAALLQSLRFGFVHPRTTKSH